MFKRKQPTPQEQVSRAIRDLERGNLFILRAAHIFAFLLIIATSIASLISLASYDVIAITNGRASIPQEASAAIVLLLVAAMDTGMLYAATSIRIGRQRGQNWRQLRGHVAIMCTVAILEAGTYTYMLWQYEQPASWEAWALIVARGVAVPALSIYLAMARKITTTPEDIAHMAETFTGVGLLRDLATAANDPDLPLAQKIAIYHAAATLSDAQQSRLNALHAAVGGKMIDSTAETVEAPSWPSQSVTEPIALPPGDEADMMRSYTTVPSSDPPAKLAPKRKPINRQKPKTRKGVAPKPEDRKEAIFTYLTNHPQTSTRKLADLFGLSQATAQADKRAWKASRDAQAIGTNPD